MVFVVPEKKQHNVRADVFIAKQNNSCPLGFLG